MQKTRTKAIPTKPRFKYAIEEADKLLLELGINSLPIYVQSVLDKIGDRVIHFDTWKNMKKEGASEDPFNLSRKGAWGVSFIDPEEEYHIILNDDLVVTIEAKRWTIAHELGHIILGHLDDFSETAIYRRGVSDAQYNILEAEANFFAAEFLMPKILIGMMTDVTARDIQYIFFVSVEASNKRYEHLVEKKRNYRNNFDHRILRNFWKFLIQNLEGSLFDGIHRDSSFKAYFENRENVRRCPSCYGYITDKADLYCKHCGIKLNTKELTNIQWQSLGAKPRKQQYYLYRLLYSESKGKEFKYLQACPVCLNHEIKDNALVCKVCGQPLRLLCISENKALDSPLSFCPDCGARTQQKEMLDLIDARFSQLESISSAYAEKHELLEYPYWDFFLTWIRQSLATNTELATALFYSKAYTNDEDVLVIMCVAKTEQSILKNKDLILTTLFDYVDKIKRTELEVIPLYAI